MGCLALNLGEAFAEVETYESSNLKIIMLS
jgi:hypothetical protein